jgi:hypothetical protein
VAWLGVTPGVAVSSQPPQGDLHESFTITIFLQHPLHSEGFRPILTETVYPLADGGPVALVRSRTIYHEFGPYPRWVVPAGWRTRTRPNVCQRFWRNPGCPSQSSSPRRQPAGRDRRRNRLDPRPPCPPSLRDRRRNPPSRNQTSSPWRSCSQSSPRLHCLCAEVLPEAGRTLRNATRRRLVWALAMSESNLRAVLETLDPDGPRRSPPRPDPRPGRP